MLILKYNNDSIEYNINFIPISENIVRIEGIVPRNTSGFTLTRQGKNDNWDYSNYNTIYKYGSTYVEYSNDGSVYTEKNRNRN